MSCISIKLKKTPSYIPVQYLGEDGYAYLDIPEGADIKYFKNLNQLTDINEIPFDFVVAVPLAATEKNNKILSKYIQGSNDYTEVLVYNGHFWVNFLMSVQEVTYEEISCEFISYSFYWAKQLEAKPLNKVKVGKINQYDWARGYNLPAHPNNIPIPVPYNQNAEGSSVAAYPLCDWGDLRYITDNFYPVGGAGVPIDDDDDELDIYCTTQRRPKTGDSENDNITPTQTGPFYLPVYPRIATLGPTDFRPFVFIYKLIKQIFAEEGYELVSPILNSPQGRSVIAYLLDPELSQENLEPTRTIYLYPDGYTPSDITFTKHSVSFTSLQWYRQRGGVYDIDVQANIHFRPSSKKNAKVVTKLLIKEQGDVVDIVEIIETSRPSKDKNVGYGNVVLKIQKSDIILKEGQTLEVVHYFLGDVEAMIIPNTSDNWGGGGLSCAGTDTEGESRTQMQVTQKHKIFWRDFDSEGNLELGTILDKNITCLSLMKSIVHLYNLKIYTDFTKKIIYMMQPDDINWFGDEVEGFFQPSNVIKTIPTTYKVQPTEKIKEVKLSFKDSDAYHDVIPISNEGEIVDLENPIFEPTLFQVYGRGSSIITGEGNIFRDRRAYVGFDLFPNMAGELEENEPEEKTLILERWRNMGGGTIVKSFNIRTKMQLVEKPEILFDVSPRIMMYYGARRQPYNNYYYIKSIRLSTENVLSSVINTAGHYHPSISQINPTNEGTLPSSSYSRATQTLYFKLDKQFYDTYGYSYLDNDKDTNLSYLYYNWLKCYYLNPTIKYLIDTKPNNFFGISMRELSIIEHIGLPKNVIIEAIDDYSSCKPVPVEYTFKSYSPNMYPICESYRDIIIKPRTVYRCLIDNNPLLSVRNVGDDIELKLSGLNTDPIEDVEFEISIDGVDWNPIINYNAITAYVPNTGDTLQLRANVEYQNCSVIPTPVVEYNPCSAVILDTIIETITTNIEGQTCTKANIILEGDYTVEDFTYTIEGVTLPYVEGTEICDFDLVLFIIEIKIGECKYTEQLEVIGGSVTCPVAEDITIDYNHTDGMFYRIGDLNTEPLEDLIYYSTENQNDEWSDFDLWDNNTPVYGQRIRARRVIRFCGECEDICTPILLWEDFTEFTLGCDNCTLFVEQGGSGCTVSWVGPNGFTGTGTPIEAEDSGNYTATITCNGIDYTASIDYVKPNSGTPTGNPIILTF